MQKSIQCQVFLIFNVDRVISQIHRSNNFFVVIEVGPVDMSFNARRNILATISLGGKIAYHLHSIEYTGQKDSYSVQLLRKSKWYAEYGAERSNFLMNFLAIHPMTIFTLGEHHFKF